MQDLLTIIRRRVRSERDSITVTDRFDAVRPPVERLRTISDSFSVRDYFELETGTLIGPSVDIEHGIADQ